MGLRRVQNTGNEKAKEGYFLCFHLPHRTAAAARSRGKISIRNPSRYPPFFLATRANFQRRHTHTHVSEMQVMKKTFSRRPVTVFISAPFSAQGIFFELGCWAAVFALYLFLARPRGRASTCRCSGSMNNNKAPPAPGVYCSCASFLEKFDCRIKVFAWLWKYLISTRRATFFSFVPSSGAVVR